MSKKTCPGCNTTKPLTEFNWKCKALGVRQVRCRCCTAAQVRRHYKRNRHYYITKARARNNCVYQDQRERVLAYLSEHPCVDCGEADVVCLEFDHVRGRKRGNVAHILGDHSWEVIEAEIAKCVVRCANCHRRKTARQRGWYRAGPMISVLLGARSSTG
jgi:hypothetical protein